MSDESDTLRQLVVVHVQATGDENQFNYEPVGGTPVKRENQIRRRKKEASSFPLFLF